MSSIVPKVEPTTPQQQATTINPPYTIQHPSRAGKVPKPIMEKRRRARINKCLEELKSLVPDLSESGARVDKADVLEMTVEHLTKMKNKRRNLTSNLSTHATPYVSPQLQFRQGYQQCMSEVAKILFNSPVDQSVAQRLVQHLSHRNPIISSGGSGGVTTGRCNASPYTSPSAVTTATPAPATPLLPPTPLLTPRPSLQPATPRLYTESVIPALPQFTFTTLPNQTSVSAAPATPSMVPQYPSPPNSPDTSSGGTLKAPQTILSLPSVARRPIRPIPKVWRPW